jgi:hypothetical protein
MKRLLSTAKVLLPIIVLLSVSGCFQYPEGPVFTVQTRDERLKGTWTLTSATDANGNDVISEFNSTTLTAVPSRSTANTWDVFKNGTLVSHGTYLFAEHGDQIVVAYSFINNAHTVTQEIYDIRKLTDKYFYYVDNNSNTLHFQKY